MKSEGQKLALQQLEDIASYDNYVFEITNVIDPNEKFSLLRIDSSLYCGDFEKAEGGLPLRERERFRFFIRL